MRSIVPRRSIVAFVAVAGACLLAACRQPQRVAPRALTADTIALNNRGVGLMGQFEYGQARAIFERLSVDHPDRLEFQINRAIATLHRQSDGDSAEAQRILERVVADDATQLRAHYNLGLLLLHDGQGPAALPHFVIVTEREPADAFGWYFAGQCRFQQADFAGALVAYERALANRSRLRSAAYGAFQARQRLGRPDAQQMLEQFRALETNPQSEVAEFKYTRLGPLAEAATIDEPVVSNAPRPAGALFEHSAPLVDTLPPGVAWRSVKNGTGTDARPVSITAADINGDGRIDLFIPRAIDDRGTVRNAVLLNGGDGRFALDRTHTLASVPDVEAALWGDVDNDGHVDVYLCRRGANQLWKQTASGRWSNTGAGAHADGGGGVTVDGALVDADHDGDLDILLLKEGGAVELLNNNGDGTFRALGSTMGLPPGARPAIGLVVADLDADRDADLLLVRAAPPHDVHINDRMWRYHDDPSFASIAREPISAAIAADLDADGQAEIYTSGAGGIRRWDRGSGSRAWDSRELRGTEALANAKQLSLVDVDGDGRLDLIGTTSAGNWEAVALQSNGDAKVLYAGEGSAVAGWAVAFFETGRGPSMVAILDRSAGGPLVWRPGTGRHPFVTVSLSGRDPRSAQIRSNASGIGTHLAVRTGSRWTALDSFRPQSGVGQSLQPLAIGTGGASQIDFVALVWPDGVFQSEIGLVPGAPHTIAETQRQLSSCPVLFAFDGKRFAFVTDLLGVGGIGTPTSPGVYDPPRPRESVLLPDRLLAPHDGLYDLKISEPMEEVAYIDSAALVAYDLPPGWQMALDERRATSAPEATGDPIFFRQERLPVEAVTRDGPDVHVVTRLVTSADGVAAPAGRVDPRHIGRTDEHSLVLGFDRTFDAPNGSTAVLIADGWIEYPYAQTLFAAWQAGALYRAPSVDARGTDNQWHVVREQFGYPAGMARRMSVPLGPLPRGTRQLRLRTTQEIYWDRLAVAFSESCPLASRHVLPLTSARLARTGFPRRATTADRRPSYDYDERAPLSDMRYPRGLYTAEGTATELLAREDGALAIIGPGEELHLEFSASLRPLGPGWTRRFVLEARGWCKDMDLYTKDGETVDPVPGNRDADADRLQRRYTTRYESGR